MIHAPQGLVIDNRALPITEKRKEQKYLILLSNHVTIIDGEWSGMKKAVRHRKPIIEMMETDARIHSQETGLNKLLESLDTKISEEETNLKKSKYKWPKK